MAAKEAPRRAQLTNSMIEKMICPETGEYIIWDAKVPGLGVRLRSTGGKSFFLKKGAKGRWHLGNAKTRPVSDARAEALGILAQIEAGVKVGRKPRPQRPTVSYLMATYMVDHVKPHCDENTYKDYQRTIALHIDPVLGQMYADDVAAHDIDKLIGQMKDTPSAGNKTLALLKAAFHKGMRWGIRSQSLGNPCIGATPHETQKHEEFLEKWELDILLEILRETSAETNRYYATACISLLAVTGCRRDEVRAMRWEWIDWQRNKINWPDDATKTGAKGLMLNKAALAILSTLQERDAETLKPHLFKGENEKLVLPKATLYRTWYDVKKRAIARGLDPARLKRMRPHDLRHSFASLNLSAGLSLADVQLLLGHKNQRSTERYARHVPSREIALAGKVSDMLEIQ